MSDFKAKAAPIAEKIKSIDFEGAYAMYFKEMDEGIAECPLDMIDFSNEIEGQVNDCDIWDKWEDWTWEHESKNSQN